MVQTFKALNGPYLVIKVDGERTKYLGWLDLFNMIWNDYVRGKLPNYYVRGVLFDLGLTSHQVFHALEQLQVGKTEYDAEDYPEVSYI